VRNRFAARGARNHEAVHAHGKAASLSPRETLANLSIRGHLRCFSYQPGSKIIHAIGAGEISSTR
jgi:hypothetical protein